MRLSILIVMGMLLLLVLPEHKPPKPPCKEVKYIQRGRQQTLTVCKDTLRDTGTAHQHKSFQDTIKTIRENL